MIEYTQTLEISFMPSLLSLLFLAEKNKGMPLTKEEVVRIRDNAVCITISSDRLKKLEDNRGYKDIDPENCWEEWLFYKEEREA